jgi:hypothetical protein
MHFSAPMAARSDRRERVLVLKPGGDRDAASTDQLYPQIPGWLKGARLALPRGVALMAAIRFAFADNAGLDERDALTVAELLSRERNLAAQNASRKIRDQAERDVDRHEVSLDVELEPVELDVLADVLDALPSAEMSDAMQHVRAELRSR